MGKPTICIGENKDAFVFATRIVQFLLYLNPKFQVSSFFLCLYRSVCVRPGRKPHCWFSHEAAQISISSDKILIYWVFISRIQLPIRHLIKKAVTKLLLYYEKSNPASVTVKIIMFILDRLLNF